MITSEDYMKIQNLAFRYALTTDNADVDGFMNCWVSASAFGGYESGPFGSMKTWEELRDFEAHHVGEGGMADGKRHQITNLLIEPVSETEVHVTHDLLVVETANIPSIIASGRYDKNLVVKTEDGWKFKSRTLTVDPGFFKLMDQWKQNENNS
jgi:3-phenylpropionate/cinnamic acid dioxygenase small subunit